MTTPNPEHITTARIIHYKPRNTDYRVVHHNVKIKQPDGTWKLGCMYRDVEDGNLINLYTRPYDMFDDRWVVIK